MNEKDSAPTSAMLELMHRVDKAYSATAKGELVPNDHPLAVRHISFMASQEVPGPLLADYGLLTAKGFTPKPYSDVPFVEEPVVDAKALKAENAKLLAELEALKAAKK
jgi:hypothetical protein